MKKQYITEYQTELYWTWADSLNMAQLWASEGKVVKFQVM